MMKKIALVGALACGVLLQGRLHAACTPVVDQWAAAGGSPYVWNAPVALGNWTMLNGSAQVMPTGPYPPHSLIRTAGAYTIGYNPNTAGNNIDITTQAAFNPGSLGPIAFVLSATGLNPLIDSFYKVSFVYATGGPGSYLQISKVTGGGTTWLAGPAPTSVLPSLSGLHTLNINESISGGTVTIVVSVDGTVYKTVTDATPFTAGTLLQILGQAPNLAVGAVTVCN